MGRGRIEALKVRRAGATRTRRVSIPIQESIDVSKDTRKSTVDFDLKKFLDGGLKPKRVGGREVSEELAEVMAIESVYRLPSPRAVGCQQRPAALLDWIYAYRIDRAGADPQVWDLVVHDYNMVRERGEALPPSLQRWTDDVVNGRLSRPQRPAHRPQNRERAVLYLMAVEILVFLHRAKSEYAAINLIADALNEDPENIKKIVRQGRRFREE